MSETPNSAVMHCDGCHFFLWVYEVDGLWAVSWSERTGSDLAVHARRGGEDGSCDRCKALLAGSARPQRGDFTMEPSTNYTLALFEVLAKASERVPGIAE